jgi:hypothetical protein
MVFSTRDSLSRTDPWTIRQGGLSLYQVSDDQDIKAYAHCALIRQIQNFSADSRTPRSPSGFL